MHEEVDPAQHHEERQRVLDEPVIGVSALAVEVDARVVGREPAGG